MKKLGIFILTALVFSILPQAIFAQIGPAVPFDLNSMLSFVLGANIAQTHPEWLVLPNVIYYLVFPFVAIVAVIYGILSEIRIFRSANVKGVLAFVMAGMSLPTGAMITTVYYLYTFGAWVAVVTFGILFIFGTLLWGVGRGSQLKRELYDLQSDMGRLKERSAQLDMEYSKGNINEGNYIDQKNKLAAEYRMLLHKQGVMGEMGAPPDKK